MNDSPKQNKTGKIKIREKKIKKEHKIFQRAVHY
jgi:hypothetical protein